MDANHITDARRRVQHMEGISIYHSCDARRAAKEPANGVLLTSSCHSPIYWLHRSRRSCPQIAGFRSTLKPGQ